MRRDEPVVNQRFRKDAAQEEFLVGLNRILEPHDRQWELPGERPHPTVHIIGPPRSGTTFLNQLICHHLDVGYVDHLVAAFWQAPVQGILLSRKLMASHGGSDYRSEMGRTSAISEPHEFGYFWSSHLRYTDMCQKSENHSRTIDWIKLCDVLERMTRAYDRPMLFKPFLLAWHLRDFQRVAPSSCFIRLQRDPVDNAVSLLNARREFLQDANQWLSLRPLGCQGLESQPVWHQVAAQVHQLESWLDEQTSRLRPGSVLALTYEEICRDPGGTVRQVRSFLAEQGILVNERGPVPVESVRKSPERLTESSDWHCIARLMGQWGRTSRMAQRRPDAA